MRARVRAANIAKEQRVGEAYACTNFFFNAVETRNRYIYRLGIGGAVRGEGGEGGGAVAEGGSESNGTLLTSSRGGKAGRDLVRERIREWDSAGESVARAAAAGAEQTWREEEKKKRKNEKINRRIYGGGGEARQAREESNSAKANLLSLL